MSSSKPVDIVYLWVDGNDPAWRAKRQRTASRLNHGHRNAMAQYGNVEGRFRDNDELRYSLRALDRFFPDHGHVYLVTDAQVPAWLRASDNLTVVDHHDLIAASLLPTFDSANIESYIHHIPNLSERYFYLNDDVFFGAPVQLEDWFWDGGVYAAWSDDPEVSGEALQRSSDSLENACRRSIAWLKTRPQADFMPQYRHIFRTFAHSPRPMLRSMLFGLEELAPDMFGDVRSTAFRAWNKPTIVSDFVMRWALAYGACRLKDYRHLHLSTGCAQEILQLDVLAAEFGAVDFFCINDTTDDALPDDPRLLRVRQQLQHMLPLESRYEKCRSNSLAFSGMRFAGAGRLGADLAPAALPVCVPVAASAAHQSQVETV